MKRIARSTLQTAVNLVFFAIIGTAILASVFFMTHDAIVKSEEAEKLKLITQIVPPSLFDNDIIQDTLSIPADPLLGNDRQHACLSRPHQGRTFGCGAGSNRTGRIQRQDRSHPRRTRQRRTGWRARGFAQGDTGLGRLHRTTEKPLDQSV